MENTDSTAGFEQYVALGAGLHHIVDRVSAASYPIRDWGELMEAANSIDDDIDLIVPGGKRPLLKEVLKPNVSRIRPILGDQPFPIQDQQDFAWKAGLILMTLVVRHFGPPSPHESPNERTAAEIEAFKRAYAGRKQG